MESYFILSFVFSGKKENITVHNVESKIIISIFIFCMQSNWMLSETFSYNCRLAVALSFLFSIEYNHM
jgi:hypothetical protein